jgi:hypothetical protein
MSESDKNTIVEAILAGIDDERRLDDHPAGPSPLHDLVVAYQTLADQDDHLPAITDQSSGRELKNAIGLLAPDRQLVVLARYNHATKDLSTPTEYDPKVLKEETRSLQTQVYILGGALLFCMLSVLVGAVIATAVHMQVITAGAAIRNLMDGAKEIVVLFLDF